MVSLCVVSMLENIIIITIQFNDEQYHQKLKHSCNFDKKQRSKTNFSLIKLYLTYTFASNLTIPTFSKGEGGLPKWGIRPKGEGVQKCEVIMQLAPE